MSHEDMNSWAFVLSQLIHPGDTSVELFKLTKANPEFQAYEC